MKSLFRTAMLLITILVITLQITDLKADAKNKFKDVQAGSYYYEPVLNLSDRGIINGFGDGTFKPNQPVTREHAAVMLVKSLQFPTSNIKDPHFLDISTKHPYYKEIAALVDAGIFKGYEDKTFRPKEPLTRGQMATILTRAYHFSVEDSSTEKLPFTDVSNNASYKKAVELLYRLKITNGVTPTTFGPSNPVTRAQLATFIYKSESVALWVEVAAGNGEFNYADGNAGKAAFRVPTNLAILPDNSIVISDQGNHLIRQLKNGNVTTFAGMRFLVDDHGFPVGGLHNDVKEKSIFFTPSGLASDSMGNVYIADTANHVIRKITKEGTVITLAGDGLPGLTDGKSNAAKFYFPGDIVVAKDGTIYVADTLNHVIRKIDTRGNVTTLNAPSLRPVEIVGGVVEASGEYLDGALNQAKFNEPSGLALDEKGNLYVSDTGNQVIRYIDFSANKVTTVAGNAILSNGLYGKSGFKDGSALEARFFTPKGIVITPEGGLLIADYGNHAIRYFYQGTVKTIATNLQFPTDVAVTKEGTIFFTNSSNNQIMKITR